MAAAQRGAGADPRPARWDGRLLAYALHNVWPRTAYPATLVTTGDHDDAAQHRGARDVLTFLVRALRQEGNMTEASDVTARNQVVCPQCGRVRLETPPGTTVLPTLGMARKASGAAGRCGCGKAPQEWGAERPAQVDSTEGRPGSQVHGEH